MTARISAAAPPRVVARETAIARHRDPNARSRGLTIALWFGIGFFALLSAMPYLVMLSTMFKSTAEIAEPTYWLPKSIDLTAISGALSSPTTWTYLKNSFIIAIGETLIVMLAGIPAAYALARHEFRGRKLFLDVILITQMFSPVVLLIPLFRLYNEMGLLGTLQGVIIAGSAFT